MSTAVLPPMLPDLSRARFPESYERAKTALIACHRIDECKDWADKMAAIASYAKQADDTTLHDLAVRISARAIRRCGELLQTFQQKGGDRKSAEYQSGATPTLTQRQAAAEAGLSKDQEVTAVRVANVPADEFEAAVERDHPATVTQLAEMGTTVRGPSSFVQATHVLGTVKAFATFCGDHDAAFIAGGIEASEIIRLRSHVAIIGGWLGALTTALEDR